jgi:hypothetical protein
MTCEEFWNGEPHGPDHLGQCAACASRFERQQQLAIGLHRLGREMTRFEAPPHVERRVVAAFRARAGLPPAPRPSGIWWAIGSWAAALAVTAGLAFFVLVRHEPQRTQRITPRRMTQLAGVEAPPAADPIEMELPSDFILLPNAENIAPNEAVNLVRLELSRSTMLALGMPVAAEHAHESVEADVMLGADGVARAVRFLE